MFWSFSFLPIYLSVCHCLAPSGNYFLQLSQPYDRAILLQLLDIAAHDPNVQIVSLEYTEKNIEKPPGSNTNPTVGNNSATSGNNTRPASAATNTNSSNASRPASANPPTGGGVDKPQIGGTMHRILRFDEPREQLSPDEQQELQYLQSFEKAIMMSPQEIFEVAKKHDSQGKLSLSSLGIKRLLTELGLQPVNRILNEIKFTIDPPASGYYGIDEMVEYITEVSISSALTYVDFSFTFFLWFI